MGPCGGEPRATQTGARPRGQNLVRGVVRSDAGWWLEYGIAYSILKVLNRARLLPVPLLAYVQRKLPLVDLPL